jgi:Aspartyl protease
MEEPFLALLDTGAEYSILDREIAAEAGLEQLEGQNITMTHRDGRTPGRLVRISMRVLADEGETLLVDATVFIPQDVWPTGRNFIGYTGFLERVRVGLDPERNDIYFGV